jgi:hypothetical protein
MSDPAGLDPDEQRALEALAARYRQESTRDGGPPPAVDRAIQDAARRGAKRRWLFTPFPHNWMVPATVVALLLLTVSIVHFMPSTPRRGSTITTEDEAPLLRDRKSQSAPVGGAEAMREKAAPAAEEAPEPAPRFHGYKIERERQEADALAPERRSAATSGLTPQTAASSAPVPLEEWTARIEAMLKRGDTEAAEREMRALLAQYPDASFEQEALRELAQRIREDKALGNSEATGAN